MRWERLFSELQHQVGDDLRRERDQLADELRDELWFRTSWVDLLGGKVRLEVAGMGQVEGEVVDLSSRMLRLRRPAGELLVALDAVVALYDWHQRTESGSRSLAELGWGPVLRSLRDDEVRIVAVRRDGIRHEGEIRAVGQDFFTLAAGERRTVTVPTAALAALLLDH